MASSVPGSVMSNKLSGIKGLNICRNSEINRLRLFFYTTKIIGLINIENKCV